MVARGFIRDKSSYLRDPWNRLDFTVVVAGIVSFVLYVVDPEGESRRALALASTFELRRHRKPVNFGC